MNVESDPIQAEDDHYVEPIKILMIEDIKGFNIKVGKCEKILIVADSDMKTVYPQAKEGLIDFFSVGSSMTPR